MERIKNNTHENPKGNEQLSGKEKFEAILALFGTDSARDAFIRSCREYIGARDTANVESYAPDSFTRHKAVISSPKQSIIHNKIMDTLTRLASQAPIISPLQAEVLREMHDRNITAKIIREYLAAKHAAVINVEEKDDEEEDEKERGGMSDTAFYHFLGKEH